MEKERKKRNSVDMSSMVYGKVPPQARELEEAVLGAILLQKGAFDLVSEILNKSECFYVEAHQQIFDAMRSMQQRGMPIDTPLLVQELMKREQLDLIGGPYYLVKLTNSVVSAAHIETHARIIMEKFIFREIIRISGEAINGAYDDSSDVFDLLDGFGDNIFNISNLFLKKDFEVVSNVSAKALNTLELARSNPEHMVGVPSDFKDLDKITNGWQPTDLIILAARPSVGKTALALNLARNAANKGNAIGFFSLEMSSGQLVQRIWAAESEVPLEEIRTGRISDDHYNFLQRTGIRKLETMPMWIDDTAALNIFEFRAKARRMVNKHKVKMIIIDYLQLMSGQDGTRVNKSGNREQEISNISRNLKALAKELNIPIIALSQLSRAVETRKENKTPQLSDLRESGAIEQDADLVMFIYKPEFEQSTEIGESNQGYTEVKIAKHRSGTLGTIKLKSLLHIQKFEDWTGVETYVRPDIPSGNWKPFQMPRERDDEDTPF